jgi:hypothetical protein
MIIEKTYLRHETFSGTSCLRSYFRYVAAMAKIMVQRYLSLLIFMAGNHNDFIATAISYTGI